MGLSLLDQVAALPDQTRAEFLAGLDDQTLDLFHAGDWSVKARPEQLAPPGDWLAWFIRAGRGWGKTVTAAEWSLDRIKALAAMVERVRWFVAGPTRGDVRDFMFEGETGLARIVPPSLLLGGSWDRSFNRTDLRLNLANGAILQGFSSEKPARARGPQHHGGWCDEPGTFADATGGLDEDTLMSNLLFGLRLDPDPRMVISGTPRNNRLVRELRAMDGVVETHGKTRDNLHNLSGVFKRTVVARYAGTRLGRQELDAEILDDIGSKFQRGWFRRVDEAFPHDGSVRRFRHWDLASTEPNDSNADPDWTAGALVAFDPLARLYRVEHVVRFRAAPGRRERLIAQHALEDGTPTIWVEQAGGAGKDQVHLIASELEPLGIAVLGQPVGNRSKAARAEIVESAASQGRVSMVAGPWNTAMLDELEEFPDGPHDDQVDALSGAFALCIAGHELEGSAGDLFAGAVN